MPKNRPPPSVLFIHNGTPYDRHIKHLTDAGLHVSEAHADLAVAEARRMRPDIVILDFDCDGDVVAALKKDLLTADIPIVALAALARPFEPYGVSPPGL